MKQFSNCNARFYNLRPNKLLQFFATFNIILIPENQKFKLKNDFQLQSY